MAYLPVVITKSVNCKVYANLRYLYTGEQKAKGRRKHYDGKMVVGDMSRLTFIGEHDEVKLYSAVLNCVILKQDIRIVYLSKKTKTGTAYALLFSTDTDINPLTLYRYYKARFQIEFLFRDAKQFTGLCDCQARSEPALHSHFNACFTALNLIKWHDRQLAHSRKPISVSSWKNRFFNQLLIDRIYLNSAIDLSFIKSSPFYQQLCNFGVISY
ncbi:MAG: transposase [Methylococcales bacterium]